MANRQGIWITQSFLDDQSLSLAKVMILSEVVNLTKTSECYASNAHFAHITRLSIVRVSNLISELHKDGYLSVFYQYQGKRIKQRTITYTPFADDPPPPFSPLLLVHVGADKGQEPDALAVQPHILAEALGDDHVVALLHKVADAERVLVHVSRRKPPDGSGKGRGGEQSSQHRTGRKEDRNATATATVTVTTASNNNKAKKRTGTRYRRAECGSCP